MIRWFLKNTAFANVLMSLFIVMGAYSFFTLPREETREIKFYRVLVITIYRGAPAEEVERLVTTPIEDELDSISDVDKIVSNSYEGRSVVKVIFDDSIDYDTFDRRMQEVRTAVNRANLPSEIEDDPFVYELKSTSLFPLINVVLAGDISEHQLKDLAQDLQDRIEALPEVDRTYMGGVRDRQIWVEVDEDRLSAYGLSLDQVMTAVRAQNLNLPAGPLKLGRTEYLVRTVGEVEKPEELNDLVISSTTDGHAVRVRDIGRVLDTFEPVKTISRRDGNPSINLGVYKTQDASSIALVDQIREIVKEIEASSPPGVTYSLVGDQTVRIRDRLGVLQSNILFGFVLVAGIVYLFLGWRNAISVAAGVPISLLLTFFFMYAYGETLNSQSLFGVVLVLGMLVDDALVVVENIHRHTQMGKRLGQAALEGTKEVLWPVITSSLTTMAAFLPLALLPGVIGQFMRIVPIVVSVALAASLFECFFLLPGHVNDLGHPEAEGSPAVSAWFDRWKARYESALRRVIVRKFTVFGAVLLVLIVAMALILGVKKNLWESDEIDQFSIRVWMPEGIRVEETDKILRTFEQAALELPKTEVEAVLATAGALRTDTEYFFKGSVGEVTVQLTPGDSGRRDAEEIIAGLRRQTENVPGVANVVFARPKHGPPAGEDVEVLAMARYFDQLQEISGLLSKRLAGMGGVFDIDNDYEEGKLEITISVDERRASEYGLSTAAIARFLRRAIYGEIASVHRDGDEEIDIIVKVAGADQMDLPGIRSLRMASPLGGVVELQDIARIDVKPGVAEIHHFELERSVTTTASVDQAVGTTQGVNQAIVDYTKEIQKQFPGVQFRFEGEFAELVKSLRYIGILFVFGVFLMYTILVGQFSSLSSPFVILFTVPMAAVGVLIVLFLTNTSFSMTTIYGVVALSGVVVNDSIVMVSFFIERRRRGDSVEERNETIIDACKIRIRPMFLTTITTLLGLGPMAFGIGGRSVVWGNMARTMCAGLGVASLMAVFIIPCLYAIFDDIGRWLPGFRRRMMDKLRQQLGLPPKASGTEDREEEKIAETGGARVVRLDASIRTTESEES